MKLAVLRCCPWVRLWVESSSRRRRRPKTLVAARVDPVQRVQGTMYLSKPLALWRKAERPRYSSSVALRGG